MRQEKRSVDKTGKSGKKIEAVATRKAMGKAVGANEQKSCICTNKDCRLRKPGCKGFEACPGYKGK